MWKNVIFKRGKKIIKIAKHISVGYNHPDLLDIFKDPAVITTMVNRPALGVYPAKEWPDMLRTVLMSIAPKGLENGHVTTMVLTKYYS